MVKVLDLTVERIFFQTIKNKETGEENEIAKVLYVNEEEDFYIGYLSKYDVKKLDIVPGIEVKAIRDQGKIKILG